MNPIQKLVVRFAVGLLLLQSLFLSPLGALADVRSTDSSLELNTVELLPYSASGYKYYTYQALPEAEVPEVAGKFQAPDFVDSAWTKGKASFGSARSCPSPDPAMLVRTEWPAAAVPQYSHLLVRRWITIPYGSSNVRIMISVDNDIEGVYFDGAQLFGPQIHDNCPLLDNFQVDVPAGLATPGRHLVAFHLVDRGVESFFDTRILADVLNRPKE